MSKMCYYYWWQEPHKLGPAYCSYKDKMVALRYCGQYCLDGCYQSCKYYNEAVKKNFLELIMDCCIGRGIDVDKSVVYTALNNLRQYLETAKRRFDNITVLIFGERIGLEIADEIRNSKEANLSDYLVYIYDSYVKTFVDYVSCCEYDMAFSWYVKMLDDLITKFELEQREIVIKNEIKKPEITERLTRAMRRKKRIGTGSVPYVSR